MKHADIRKINKALMENLDEKRYEHTLGVAYTATALAMRYEESIPKAYLAGLLHDCAKCLDDANKIDICNKHNIVITKTEQKNPFLLHAKVGSFMAKDTYDVQDTDILNAILYHTTGRPNMTLLEKIIFIADYIEPNRKDAPNLELIRKTAFEDLDETLIMILNDTLEYLKTKSHDIDPMTENTLHFYMQTNMESEE